MFWILQHSSLVRARRYKSALYPFSVSVHVPHDANCLPHIILHKFSRFPNFQRTIVTLKRKLKTVFIQNFVGKRNCIMGNVKVANGMLSVDARARSIQPKISGNFGPKKTSMDRFGPTGKVSKKLVHLLRWTTFPGRTGLNFG